MQWGVGFNDVIIVSVKENCYRIHFWYIGENEAINVLKNINLKEEGSHCINYLSNIFSYPCVKNVMVWHGWCV